MPSQCTGMDPQIPVFVFETPKLSYEEALKFCPHGLCKFHSFFSSFHKNNLGAPLTVADLCQFSFLKINETELFNDLLAWTSIESGIQGPHDSRNPLSSFKLDFIQWMWMCSSSDFCIERFNKTHFKSDGKIFVLEEYFNAEPVNSPNGEWQLFPDALKLDLKDNASLLNNWSHEPGESLLMTYLFNKK